MDQIKALLVVIWMTFGFKTFLKIESLRKKIERF